MFQASGQTKDLRCTSMLARNGKCKANIVLVRIYDSANLQYALNADNEVGKCKKVSADRGSIQITARENSEAPWQMWSFDSDNMDQTQFNKETNGTPNANIPAQREKEPKVQRVVSEEEGGV
jgi:hypothetical protein